MSFTIAERLMLLNQYKILEHLDREEDGYYQRCQKIVLNGYEHQYGELGGMEFADTPMQSAESQEVLDILEMFEQVQIFSTRLGITTEEMPYLKFAGFDDNDPRESRYLGFAEFFCNKPDDRRYEGVEITNSHSPKIDMYRRMISVYMSTKKGLFPLGLSREDLQGINDAAIHPERRM